MSVALEENTLHDTCEIFVNKYRQEIEIEKLSDEAFACFVGALSSAFVDCKTVPLDIFLSSCIASVTPTLLLRLFKYIAKR